jgi:hypothetical protein
MMPETFDAVLASCGKGIVLRTRVDSAVIACPELSGSAAAEIILRDVSARGLTHIAIAAVDPLSAACRAAGLVDTEM